IARMTARSFPRLWMTVGPSAASLSTSDSLLLASATPSRRVCRTGFQVSLIMTIIGYSMVISIAIRRRIAVRSSLSSPGLAQPVFELDPCLGALVAVLDDHRRVERDSPVLAGPSGYRSGPCDHDGSLRDDEGLLVGRAVDRLVDQVVEGGRAGQDDPGAQDGSALDDRPLV